MQNTVNKKYFWCLGIVLILSLPFFVAAHLPVSPRKAKVLSFESKLNNHYWYAAANDEVYVLLKAEAKRLQEQGNTPINIALVLDRSGSMEGAKLKYVKEASYFVIDQLYSDDILSIIAYDDRVQTISPADFVKRKKALKKAIEGIWVDGATNLCGGMLEGYKQVQSKYGDAYVNRVLLLSDGLANKGIIDPLRLRDTAQNIKRWENITLSTFGIGADFDEDLMEDLAEYGGGNYYYVEETGLIPQIFMEELLGLQSIVAQNVHAELSYPTEYLTLDTVYGYPYLEEGNKVWIPFNDTFAEEEKTVLLKFKVKQPLLRSVRFTTKFSYKNVVDSKEDESQEQILTLTPTSNQELYAKQFDNIVLRNIALFKANTNLNSAIQQVDKGAYQQAEQVVQKNKTFLDEQFKKFVPDSVLIKQYEANSAYLTQINQLDGYNDYEKKVMQKVAKSRNYLLRKKKPK